MSSVCLPQVESGAASQLLGLLTRRRSSATTPSESNTTSRRSSQTDGQQQQGATATAGAGSSGTSAAIAGTTGRSVVGSETQDLIVMPLCSNHKQTDRVLLGYCECSFCLAGYMHSRHSAVCTLLLVLQ